MAYNTAPGSTYAISGSALQRPGPEPITEEALSSTEKILGMTKVFGKSLAVYNKIQESQVLRSGLLELKDEKQNPIFTRTPLEGKGPGRTFWSSMSEKGEDRLQINPNLLKEYADNPEGLSDVLKNKGLSDDVIEAYWPSYTNPKTGEVIDVFGGNVPEGFSPTKEVERFGGKFGTGEGKLAEYDKSGFGSKFGTGEGYISEMGSKFGTGEGFIAKEWREKMAMPKGIIKGLKNVGNIGKLGTGGGMKALGSQLSGAWATSPFMMLGIASMIGKKLFKGHTVLGKIARGLSKIFSDVALKENLSYRGKSPSGIPIYEFNYIDDKDTRYRGVLAQDVPWASEVHEASGYKLVDYSKIDVDFEEVI